MQKIIPELMVENVTNAINFYKNLLGFELIMKAPETEEPIWALVKNGEAEIMFYARSNFESEIPSVKNKSLGGSFLMFIKVSDIKEIYKKIKEKVKIVQELHTTPYGSQEMAFEDNSGYTITLSSDQ